MALQASVAIVRVGLGLTALRALQIGRAGKGAYHKHHGFCLEAQKFPDAAQTATMHMRKNAQISSQHVASSKGHQSATLSFCRAWASVAESCRIMQNQQRSLRFSAERGCDQVKCTDKRLCTSSVQVQLLQRVPFERIALHCLEALDWHAAVELI